MSKIDDPITTACENAATMVAEHKALAAMEQADAQYQKVAAKISGAYSQTSPRMIAVRAPYKEMTPEQMRMAINSMADDDPRLLAFYQLIDAEGLAATMEAALPPLDPARGTHAGGMIDAMATLRATLYDIRQSPSGSKLG